MRLKNKDIPKEKLKLLKQQEYRCGLCGIDMSKMQTKNLCLDHDHKHGHVRSVLCRNCNGIEGKVYNLLNRGKRDHTIEQYLVRLAHYWRKYAEPLSNAMYHPLHKTDDEKRLQRNRKARLRRAEAKAIQNLKRR